MIEEKRKMEYEIRRRKLLVFLFFMLKRRRSRYERTTKKDRQRKEWVKEKLGKDKKMAHLI